MKYNQSINLGLDYITMEMGLYKFLIQKFFPNLYVSAFKLRPHWRGLFYIEDLSFPECKDCEGKVRNGYKGENYCDIGSA